MCPCPFCTAILILLSPLLLMKKTRSWLKNKIMHHHRDCQVCQQAEHNEHMKDHTPCHCVACEKAVKVKKTVQKGVKNLKTKKRTVKNNTKKQ